MWIYATWCLGIGLTALAGYRMMASGLARALPPLWFYLVFTSVFDATLLAVRSNRAFYFGVYSAGLPIALLFKCGAVTAIFWALALNYPNFRTMGSLFFGSFAIIGIVAAWLTAFVTPTALAGSWAAWLFQVALLSKRYTSVAILVLLLGCLLVLSKTQKTPLPRLAVRAAQIMIVDSSLAMLSAWGQHVWAYPHPAAAALVATSYGAIVGFAWLLLSVGQEAPAHDISPEELEEQRQRIAATLHLIAAEINTSARSIERDSM